MNSLLLLAGLCATADADPIAELDVVPAAVVLDSPFDYAQLVVLGRTEAGETVDLTHQITAADCALVSVDELGRVWPIAEGEAVLVLTSGGHRVEVPVRVGGMAAPATPSFITDVQPVLSRTGCNAGVCHGNVNGKNGFKLSLRGYDSGHDFFALTDDLGGRRFDRVIPEESLFLKKPTGAVPHEGGQVLDPASSHYEVLRAWVAGGARFEEDAARVEQIEVFPRSTSLARAGAGQQMRVVALLSDGRERDVSSEAFLESSDSEVASVDERGVVTAVRRGEAAVLVRYEGAYAAARVFVMGDREGWTWEGSPEHNYVDTLVNEKLGTIRSRPSGLSSDAEFLRRVTLDLTGRQPTPQAIEAFLLDTRLQRWKREEVIDRLIGSPQFVEHWTNKWADLLQINSKFLGAGGARAWRSWVRAQVASNRPYDEFVADILGQAGSTLDHPAGAYWRVQREPDLAMESTTQLFLGIRFNCNKCHDHPFERWTQDQHWQLAAYFARVGRDPGGRPDEELIRDLDQGEVSNPDTGVVVPPAFPYVHAAMPADGPRRAQLVAWMTAPENPYFATSYVNRLWSYFLGVGLIEPVDDIRAGNPPTHPELLDRLTAEFIETGFDARHLIRLICRSHTYQRSLETNEWNGDDRHNFAHAYARRLPAEVLYDAIHQAAGVRPELPGVRPGTWATELVDPSVKSADGFLDLFGRPQRESVCECERKGGMSLGQALNLVNGPTVADAIRAEDGAVAEIARFVKDDGEATRELYLRFLSRPPTEAETATIAHSLDPSVHDNLASLDEAGRAEFDRRQAEWEATVPKVVWSPVTLGEARSEGGATFEAAEDGSYRVVGAKPDKDRYTLTVWSDAPKLTGLRLEVLPDDALPAKGPGRAENGNFVLGEFEVVAIPRHQPGAAKPVKFASATADFSQQAWPVAATIDGDPNKGWAILPQQGKRHVAVFEAAEDFSAEGGTLLVITLNQQFGTFHTVGRLRLSVTSSERPVRHHGLPDDVVAAMSVAPAERDDAQLDLVHRAFIATAADLRDRIRHGALQDVAWALVNSPAFLFNR
jgi:hypothetical protein